MTQLSKTSFLLLALFFSTITLLTDGAGAQISPLWREGENSEPDSELERLARAFVGLAQKVQPAVVQIRTSSRATAQSDSERERPQSSRGSGFIINPEGYILTAYHVVDEAKEVEVRFSNRQRFAAKVFAVEPQLDLALLKIELRENPPVLSLGDSKGLRAGELVASVSYPFGRESSLSLGIVSRYSPLETESFGFDFIQTDTSVGPGSSGGPLVNMKGHVVGMITMASQAGNMGFAVPISVIKRAIPKLLQNEKFAWGWLGVRVSDLTMELAKSVGLSPARGVVISTVLPGQPAAKGEVMAQDIVLTINGMEVDSPREFIRLIGGNEAGKEVTLTIFRKGQLLSRSILLGTKPKSSEGREG